MLTLVAEQSVVAEELHQGFRGKCIDLGCRRRPDRTANRHQVIPAEPLAQIHLTDQIANGNVIRFRQGFGLRVEPKDVAHHAVIGRAGQILLLSRQCVQAAQPIFDATTVNRGAKAHVGFLDRNIQILKHACQMRVVYIVEHDEARIHRLIPVAPRNNRACMTTERRLALIQSDVKLIGQFIRRSHARDPAPYNSDTLAK